MANFAPLDPQHSAHDSSSAAIVKPVDLPMDEKLRIFWEKNSRTVFALCVLALVVILGRGAYDYYQRAREAAIQGEFAAATTPDKVKQFIDQHSDHALAGIGSLQLADQAYSESKYSDASTDYRRAASILKKGPFAGRARLGLAVSKLNLGDRTGEDDLKQIANDSTELKPVRSEAAYHLATLAIDAGKNDEAIKDLELASTVDQTGSWAQRASMLRATLTTISSSSTPPVTIKLPGQP